MSGPHRLRSAGVGILVGGVIVGVVGSSIGLPLSGGLLMVLGSLIAAIPMTRPHFSNLALGMFLLGIIAVIEGVPGIGLGMDVVTLAGLAVMFGIFDIIAGHAIDWFRTE